MSYNPGSLTHQKDKVAAIKWYHKIDLGNGIATPGISELRPDFPWPDLQGKTVLDIGAWDGLYSFEAVVVDLNVICLTPSRDNPRVSKRRHKPRRVGKPNSI